MLPPRASCPCWSYILCTAWCTSTRLCSKVIWHGTAIFIIITTYLSAIKWPIIMEFMPAILFIYTAVNNLVVLYSEVLDQQERGYHAYVSLLNLNLYFTYYMLQLNCNYCITQFFISPCYLIIGCLYAFKTPDI